MTLWNKIETELVSSMKSGDKVRAETFKMLKSDLMYEKAKTGKELTDEKMLEVIARAAKKRKEAIEEYRKGNREDLAKSEAEELAIIETYLPQQMTEPEVDALITEKIASMGGAAKKDMGRIMGEIMKELKGKADGNLVKGILAKKLGD